MFGFVNASEKEQTAWQKRHAEGWAWYHNFEKPEEPDEASAEPKDPIVILNIAKEELERTLAKAMLEPTKENVLAYMVLQNKWVNQSKDFSHLWQQNILEHPEVYSLMPTTQYGVQVRKNVDSAARNKLIKKLSKSSMLLFFYEGENAFSQAFSRVVREFSKQHNWMVKPVSIDGVIAKDFPRSIRDASIAEEMQVKTFPALFLMDVRTLTAIPLAFGMATISQIEENIVMQFEE